MEMQRQIQSGTSIDLIGEDLLQNIISRLPALSYASASCVNRSWNLVCGRVLSRPKLVSALSLNPSLQDALAEVFEKVLAQPIRPHFAIASVGRAFSLEETHNYITAKLRPETPVITSTAHGVIGRDVLTNELKEVQWEVTEDDDPLDLMQPPNANRAIVLTVGYLPGLKVDAIPLQHSSKGTQSADMDDFVMDIKEFSNSVSGWSSPAAILIFSKYITDIHSVLQKIDCAIPLDTVVVGDGSCEFLYRGDCRKNSSTSQSRSSAPAVALVLVRDRYKPHDLCYRFRCEWTREGIGETKFHVALSRGMSPIGPIYKARSVKENPGDNSTWLTANTGGLAQDLDGQTIINDIYDEIGDRVQYPAFYIGVLKNRKCKVGRDKVRWIVTREFHEVLGGDEQYLYASNMGIKTGDLFRFYHSDSSIALSSCNNVVSNNLKLLKEECEKNKSVVFGSIIFSCCGRGESFFGISNVDTSPIVKSFPEITLAGSFSAGEIARGDSTCYDHTNNDQESPISGRCCLHVFSSVYLVMSYTPPALH